MSQYQRLLLIADPDMRRTPAFERAAWLARTTGAALHVGLFGRNSFIGAVARIDAAQAQTAREAWLAQRRTWLAQEAESLNEQGLAVSTQAVWSSDVAQDVAAQARELRADLVIKDVHHEPALKRLLLKPLDWQLLRSSPVPVLLVNTLAHAVPRRVLAAVDAADGGVNENSPNDRVVRAALALSIQCDAELHMVYCFDTALNAGVTASGVGVDFSVDLYEALQTTHRENFERLAQRFGVPADRAHFLAGSAGSVLPDFAADHRADALVMGTAQRTGLDRLLLGSTTEIVLERIGCDVLAVPTV